MENKSDISVITSAKAVVIGCSHNNSDCDHQIHPSQEDFFTIDILKTLKPDLCMDITKDKIPDELKNKFQLTILEYLPGWAYNLDKTSKKYFNNDGENGLRSVQELTSDNGFIMVVGNSRTYWFRNSIASLHYLEIAKSNDDYFILLIPKNQSMDASEVMQQIQHLPKALQNSIQTATSTKGYTPLIPLDFCKLNYSASKINEDLIDHLNLYKSLRNCEAEYIYNFRILDFGFSFGFSRDEKIKATDALIDVLLGNAPKESLIPHQEVLSNGRLKTIIDSHLNGRSISALIDNKDHKNTFVEFKAKFADIKQETFSEEKQGIPSISYVSKK